MHWQAATETSLRDLIAHPRVGLISDFDGTLSPIVNDPQRASISPHKRELLATIAAYLPLVALISGRGVADLQRRVEVPNLVYVGNHGLERWVNGNVVLEPEAEAHRESLQTLQRIVRLPAGMEWEDKSATLAIHYRSANDPPSAAEAFWPRLQEATAKLGLRANQGRMIFEIKPPVDIDKGTSLTRLAQDYNLGAVIVMGDDVTDVDAMRAAQNLRDEGRCAALNLGVRSPEMAQEVRDHSDLFLSDTDDVEDFLAWLLDAISRRAS
ncbi:MAG: trehalose-phosphatase [Anaerolineales bacterium]